VLHELQRLDVSGSGSTESLRPSIQSIKNPTSKTTKGIPKKIHPARSPSALQITKIPITEKIPPLI
jgi:hypothetical protein